jgi:DNA-binding CsgD family transcriptional regulator
VNRALPDQPATSRFGLVGRDEAVAALDELVHGVARGRGGAVWVVGEPGIGKSALLDAGFAAAEPLGCQVFRASADELGQRFPLRVLLDCLRVTPAATDAGRQEILAVLRSGGPANPAGDPLPAVVDRLLELVDRLCAAAPVVLVLDDLQWVDQDSLLVWGRLGRALAQLPLLLAAAYRPVPRRPELVGLRRQAAAAGALMLDLDPLPPDSVATMVGDLLGTGTVGPRLRQAVQRAAGNPLYVREMVDALAREGRIRTGGGTADLTGAGREPRAEGDRAEDDRAGVPISLAAAISDRLGFLSEAALGVLRAAALLGTEFAVTDLAVLLDRRVAELAPVIEEATAAGVLVESGLRLAFRHALIREVLSDRTPAALRLALHWQAARSLAAADAAAERVAQHLLAALPAPGPDGVPTGDGVDGWVLDWLAGPGRALTHRSPRVAAELLGRAVTATDPDDPRREELQARLAGLLLLTGSREEAVRLARRVRATARDPVRLAELTWTLAFALINLQRYDEAAVVVAEGRRGPEPGEIWSVRLAALERTVEVTRSAYDPDAARATLADAERSGDLIAGALATNAVVSTLAHRGEPAAALTVVERGLARHGPEPEAADVRVLMLQNRLALLGSLDRLAEADAAAQELMTVAERYAGPHRLAGSRGTVAEHYYQVGRWDDAVAVLDLVENEGTGADLYRLMRGGLLALIAARRDDQPAAEAWIAATENVPAPPGTGASHAQYLVMARAILTERQGRPEVALALLAPLLQPAMYRELSDTRLWLPEVVRLALATGAADVAGTAAEVAAADAAKPAATTSQRAAAQHCQGLLAADPAPLLAAADTYRDLGRSTERAQALADAAGLLAAAGDLTAARAGYTEAVDLYAAVGAEWDILRTESLLRPYGLRRTRARQQRPTSGWAALTPKELAIAQLVADGLPNPDIAARMFLSRRTVEVHVSHILTKLGVRSRLEIALAAADRAAGAEGQQASG